MKYPYIIIDIDTKAVRTIQLSLEENTDYICVGVAKSEEAALDMILEKRPSLVFLSPEISDNNGACTKYNLMIELVKYINQLPEFIVISDSVDFAVEGIRNKILDYIVKPLKKSDLIRAILRFERCVDQTSEGILCFKSYGDYRFIDVEEVLYLKADNNTTDFIMSNGNRVEAFKTLKHFQDRLPDHFVRIHNSYIVNIHYVSRIHFGKAKCSIKNTNDMIPFSKSYKNKVEGFRYKIY